MSNLPDPESEARGNDQREALIATLEDLHGMQALREALNESEDEWLHRVAATILRSPKEVD